MNTLPPAPQPTDFEAARQAFGAGLQAQAEGRLAEAEAQYRLSLQHLPGRPSTLTDLGLGLLMRQRPADALPCFEAVLAAEPDNPAAWQHRGATLARLGRPAEALDDTARALAMAPGHGALWAQQGHLLKDLGRPAEARQALLQAQALGADNPTTRYLLASLGAAVDAPPVAPADYVSSLFDSYADSFDDHLVQQLGYGAPQRLVQTLVNTLADPPQLGAVLDIGCGTGLAGVEARPHASRLVGVDLSAGMLDKARGRGCYDALHQADLAAWMGATAERFDTLLAADVFIYIGALDEVFAGMRRVLRSGGWLALSVEEAAGPADYELRDSARYAQRAGYLHALAARHGLQLRREQRAPLRLHEGQPLAGLYLWLQG